MILPSAAEGRGALNSIGDHMNDLATQILAFIKAHPEWAICVIGVTAFGSRSLLSSAVSRHRHPHRLWHVSIGRHP